MPRRRDPTLVRPALPPPRARRRRRARERWLRGPEADARSPLVIGQDCARFGDDENTLLGRRGHWMYPPVILPQGRGPEVATKAVAQIESMMFRSEGRLPSTAHPCVYIDVAGIGASVYDSLWEKRGRKGSWSIVPTNNGSAAHDAELYANRRAELWYETKTWLNAGGKLPHDDLLQADLLSTKYELDSKNRILLEPKKKVKERLKRSPDRGDACTLATQPYVDDGVGVEVPGM